MGKNVTGWVVLIVVAVLVNGAGMYLSNDINDIKTENARLYKENARLTFRLQGITKILWTEENHCVLCHIPFWEFKV